jgi:type II secretory ATPase GspE/PulE/Tfp pilus assembly ATPase PilB-like protein
VRFRIDGVLREVLAPQKAIASAVVSRIKVMARLDIAEKRLPQDGRIGLRIAGRPVDVRVSTIPAGYGERVVLRLLDKQAGKLDLSSSAWRRTRCGGWPKRSSGRTAFFWSPVRPVRARPRRCTRPSCA